jgi:hypothetical protein
LERKLRDRIAWAIDRKKSTFDLLRQIGQKLAEYRRQVDPQQWEGALRKKFGITPDEAAGFEDFYRQWAEREMHTAEVERPTLAELVDYGRVWTACMPEAGARAERRVAKVPVEAAVDTCGHNGEEDAATSAQPAKPVGNSTKRRQRAKSGSRKTDRGKGSTAGSKAQPRTHEAKKTRPSLTPDQRRALLKHSPKIYSAVMRGDVGLAEALEEAQQGRLGSTPTKSLA